MSDFKYLKLSFPEPDLAWLVLDDPHKSANILSRVVLEELNACLDQLVARGNVTGLVIASAKPGIFVAGADLREFVAQKSPTRETVIAIAAQGRELFMRLSKMPFVTVAAIDGMCVGGGAELAIWCDRRLVTNNPKAQFGFPEVKLGMFPGWGGTVRFPRVAGLGNAAELITSGESIDGRALALMGVATDCVAPEHLEAAARQLVREEQKSKAYLADRKRWAQPIEMSETELTFLGATAAAFIQQQTKGQYPAPVAALELLLAASSVEQDEAGRQESESFAELFGTPINRSLINVFFLTDRNKKDPGIAAKDIKPAAVKSMAVIGAGIMGSGITAASIKRDITVALTDSRPDSLANGARKALEEASYNKATKGPDVEKALKLAPLLRATTADEELAQADLVIEAIIEQPAAKQELYARLEPHLGPNTILASNTSAISIGQLAEGLKHPDRFVGIHFFNPVRQMPLVEIIRGPKTSDQTVATAVAYAKAVGKSPIVMNDGPGFLVNRLLLPYMNEALELVAEGVSLKAVDDAAKRFGMPMGPLVLYDVVGLDTALHAGHVMHQAFPDRVRESPILTALVKAGRLGQKTGRGLFKYDGKKPRAIDDPEVAALLAPHIKPGATMKDKQITERLFLPMVLEATRILAEKIVRDPRDVDLGLIFGIGFPPFKGGLLFWADTLGAAKVVEMLKPYESLGARYQPTPMLLELAKSGRRFYEEGPG
ncbi:MAG: enoyl-CoA hydratase/isomerase family protein [Planctomycetes bacterium]|nr:enoyl-CoA hydratase/isomerase family protein [Planctomycetota bacterium]